MCALWLFKTEPSDYSWDDLLQDGRTVWDGVGNNLALIHLRAVKRGDRAFIYHTGKDKAIFGISKIVKGPYPDPERDDPRRTVVDLKPEAPLDHPVTLRSIKQTDSLLDWDLVRNSRLSVMPVSESQWKTVLALSG